jgi:predicted permease
MSALADALSDLRFGLRQMARRPALYGLALLSLGLALGANTAIFSVADALFFRGAPGIGEPSRLVAMYARDRDGQWGTFPYSDFVGLQKSGVFSGLAAQLFPVGVSFSLGGDPEMVQGLLVSREYFSVLKARPVLGRTFGPGEKGETGVVIGHALWRRRFASDPGAVGKAVTLNGAAFTVIGVMPEGFRGPTLEDTIDVWIPLDNVALVASGPIPKDVLTSQDSWFSFLGRLRPGVPARAATARLQETIRALRPGMKIFPQVTLLADTELRLGPGGGDKVGLFIALLAGAVALTLAAACANVANLLLVRAAERRRELAVRAALGAGRGRMVRQILAESLLLGLAGAVLGVLIARLARPLVSLLQVPVIDSDLRLDGRILLFSLAVSQLTALLFGLAPALLASRQSPALVLRATASGGRLLPRQVLAGAQVALATVLAIGAGLFLRTLANFGGGRLGYQPERVLTATLDLSTRGYATAAVMPFFDDLTRRLAALPGVEAVSRTSSLPYAGEMRLALFVEGKGEKQLQEGGTYVIYVGEDYFRSLGIPLTAGRDFTLRDDENAPGVVIVNQALAKLAWPGESPLGRRVRFEPQAPPFELIGVVGDTTYRRPREPGQPIVYLAHRQSAKTILGPFFRSHQALLIRATGRPGRLARALRDQVRALDRGLSVQNLKTLDEQVAAGTARERRSAQLLAALAGLAVALTAVGLYGVLAASVTQRTREIGIRMAIGEDRPSILTRILRGALLLGVVGVFVGALAALWLTALVRAQLFGVAPTDPLTFSLAALLLLLVALCAALAPALRATRIQPAVALRVE